MSTTLSKPSFTFGYWRPWKNNSNIIESWLDYNRDNQRSQYVSSMIIDGIKEIGSHQIHNLNKINNTLELGFLNLSYDIEYLSNNIINGTIKILENQERIIQIQLAQNIYLSDIRELLTLSDSDKEKYKHIKDGCKFIKSISLSDNYYNDAKDSFNKSLQINNKDFISLFYLGYIHLFSSTHFDINKSLEYFQKSLHYARIDNSEEIKIINKYYQNEEMNNTSFLFNINTFIAQCYYLMSKDDESLKYAEDSFKIIPSSGCIQVLKYSSRLNYKEKIKLCIDDIFDSGFKNWKLIFSEFDILQNEYTMNLFSEKIEHINSEYKILENKIINSESTSQFVKEKFKERLNQIKGYPDIIEKYKMIKEFDSNFLNNLKNTENNNKEKLDFISNQLTEKLNLYDTLKNSIDTLYNNLEQYPTQIKNLEKQKSRFSNMEYNLGCVLKIILFINIITLSIKFGIIVGLIVPIIIYIGFKYFMSYLEGNTYKKIEEIKELSNSENDSRNNKIKEIGPLYDQILSLKEEIRNLIKDYNFFKTNEIEILLTKQVQKNFQISSRDREKKVNLDSFMEHTKKQQEDELIRRLFNSIRKL